MLGNPYRSSFRNFHLFIYSFNMQIELIRNRRHWDRCENGMRVGRRPALGKLTVSWRNRQINIVISAWLEASLRCCRNTCVSNLSVEREVTLDRHMCMEVWGGRIKSKKRQHV